MLGWDPLASLKFLPHGNTPQADLDTRVRNMQTVTRRKLHRCRRFVLVSKSDERGDMSQSPEVLMDDLFVHVSDDGARMYVAYRPDTPVNVLGQAFELVVKRDMDVTDHYYDIDWGREVSVCTPRIPHG